MKLSEYFDWISQKNIDESSKIKIYARVANYKQHRRSLIKNFSFASKSLIMAVFLVVMFWVQIDWLNLVNIATNNVSNVSADYVGKILNVKWVFKIISNWRELQSDRFKDWDKIMIGYGSEIVFSINDWTTSKIVWPAEVMVKFVWSTNWVSSYVFNLIEWTFVEVSTPAKSQTSVLLKTSDLEIEPSNSSQASRYSIVTKWKQKYVQNQWSDLIVQKTIQQKKNTTTLWSNKIVEVTDNVKLVNNSSSLAKDIKLAINQNLIPNQTPTNELNSWEKITETNTKSVLKWETLEIFQSKVNSAMLAQIAMMAKWYAEWKTELYKTSINNLWTSIAELNNSLELNLTLSYSTMAELNQLTKKAIEALNKKYYISPSLLNPLNKLQLRSALLSGKKPWSLEWQEWTLETIVENYKIENPSIYLWK